MGKGETFLWSWGMGSKAVAIRIRRKGPSLGSEGNSRDPSLRLNRVLASGKEGLSVPLRSPLDQDFPLPQQGTIGVGLQERG